MSPAPNLVSIITPAYNAERFIRQTIESVRQQTYPHWELLLIIDANSKDDTKVIAYEYSARDSRIRILAEQTKGVAANRNLGIRQAKGNLLCLLDSDDWWHPDKLLRQVNFMSETGAAFSYTAYTCMAEDGNHSEFSIEAPAHINYFDLLKNNSIGCLTVMIDLTVYRVLEFRQENHEDYSLWLRLLRDGTHACGLNENLAYYRHVRGSRSDNKFKAALWRWRIYRYQEKLSWLSSMGYFSKYLMASLFKRLVILFRN